MTEPIRIVLVDDQELVRAGLALVINSQADMTVVGQAGDGAAAIRTVAAVPCDVVLMDVRMPVLDGLAATAAITRDEAEQPTNPGQATDPTARPRIVMLTTYDLDDYLLAAIHAGASGFLLKDAPPEDLLTAIRTVHAGDAVIAPASTRRLIEHIAAVTTPPTAEPPHFDTLTEREKEVLTYMAKGLSNNEIATALVVAEATVKTHVGHILLKLGARDRVQAVVAAYEGGLVRPGLV
jgi:DNA-binding NarL/FixJ family response regulator